MYNVRSSALKCVDERPRQRAAVDRLQDRRLDLDEAFVVEEAADRGDDLGARDEDLAGLLVGHQVQLAVAQARLGVGQPGVLVGRRAQRLGQQLPVVDLDRQLAAAGLEDRAVDAQQVAEVERDQRVERLLAEHVARARAAGSGPCGRRGPGTPPCPARGARAGGRRRARAPRSPRRVRVLRAGAFASAIGVTPAYACGNGSTPASRSASSLRRRVASSSEASLASTSMPLRSW